MSPEWLLFMFQKLHVQFQSYKPSSPNFLVFGGNVVVAEVLQAMAQAQVNCVFVMEQGELLGSFSETDMIRVCADGRDVRKIPLTQVLTPSIASISAAEAEDPIKLMETFERFPVPYLPVIGSAQDILRVITREQAHQAGQPITQLHRKQVREVLTTQVLQISSNQTLQQVAKIMSYQQHRYSVVVAPNAAVPIGVLTLGDLIQAQRLGNNFQTTTAAEVMSAPPKMVRLEDDLWTAYQTLQQYFLKGLVVVDQQGELAGIVELNQMLQLLDSIDLWHSVVNLRQQVNTQAIALEQAQRQQTEATYTSQRLQQELLRTTQELERLVQLDPLTQLPNRRQFDQLLAQEWQRLRRDKHYLSLVLAKIDFFQEYNDHFGYSAGNNCLQRIGLVLSEATQRVTDIVSRYDGAVFALLLPNTDLAGTVVIVERIQQALAEQALPHPGSSVALYVTLSFGLTTCIPNTGSTFADLLTAVDRALYRAKEQGGNTYRIAVENEFSKTPKFKVLGPAEFAAL